MQLARAPQVVERAERLLERRRRVGLVAEEEVEPLGAEPGEARVDGAEERPAREPAVVRAVADRVEGLGAQQHLIAHGRAPLGEPLADRRLAAPAAVGVGGVEHVDAELEGGVHERERLLVALALAVELGGGSDAAEVAAAECDARDLKPGRAERAKVHGAHDCAISERPAAAARAAASSTGSPQKASGVEKISMSR